jgi:hypothetical protein
VTVAAQVELSFKSMVLDFACLVVGGLDRSRVRFGAIDKQAPDANNS